MPFSFMEPDDGFFNCSQIFTNGEMGGVFFAVSVSM